MIAYLLFCILCAILGIYIGIWALALWLGVSLLLMIGDIVLGIIKLVSDFVADWRKELRGS